jgi:anti-sigma factor RsiW
MKPCTKNRKLIAWLVLGELKAEQRKSLRAHLEECEGCRAYFEEMSGLAETLAKAEMWERVQAGEAFHQKVVDKLRAEESRPLDALLEQFRWALGGWHWQFGVACIITLAVIAMFALLRPASIPVTSPPGRGVALESRVNDAMEPTLSNYEMVANLSFEKFDQLLSEQGSKNVSPMPVYRALAIPPVTGPD